MNNYINAEIRRIVANRANNVCEYCLIAEEDAYFRFQVEHIISRKHDGSSELDNLALSCIHCNRYKGSDISTLKPNTEELIRLYNPRKDKWREHFDLNKTFIESLTEIGEATTRILQINNDEQLLEREILIRQKRYLSDSAILLITEH